MEGKEKTKPTYKHTNYIIYNTSSSSSNAICSAALLGNVQANSVMAKTMKVHLEAVSKLV